MDWCAFTARARRRGFLTGFILALLAVCLAAVNVARAGTQPLVVLKVYAAGSVPGLSREQIPRYLTDIMTTLKLDGWSFVVGAPTAPPAADRIEWTFKPLPYAGNTLTRVGRLLSNREDLFGHYRFLKVEVRVYLGGEYQTMSFKTAEVQGGQSDPKLTELVRTLVGPLLTIGLDRDVPSDVNKPMSAPSKPTGAR